MSASFDYYRTFYYVAKYKNFTRAATMLLSSQPSVTRSIQNLESELGCRLFIRSRHGVTLTPEGEMLYRYVAPACERILRGEEELGLSLGLHGGAVSVGATETALHCLLLDRLALFQKEHPDVKIRIVGYADKFGPINVNLRISQERAEAVANMLKKDYGINSNRMVIEYVGKEKPYYNNNNKWNRCAMVEIIK
mgnify:CR=1 FL=1